MTRWRPDLTAGLAAVAAAVGFAFSYGPGTLRMSVPSALVVAAAAATTVWLAGRRPRAALAVLAALAVGLPLIRSTFAALDLVAVLVLFQAALRGALRPWVLAGVGLAVLTVNDWWLRIAFDRPVAEAAVLYPALLTALAVGLGEQGRRVRDQHAALLALGDADRRRAVSDERRRIARDLHDVAAHHLSALVVRNKLATQLDTPQALRRAAGFTATTAAQALDSLRQVVHVLGTEDDPPLAPQPTLADLDEVLARMAAAGLTVEQGPVDPVVLRRDVEVAAVRITQEALANVLRHRGPGRSWVALRRAGGAVELVIDDDGPSPPPAAVLDGRAGGYGLLGMRERAESCGGRLQVAASPRGGWRIAASLPAAAP